jgi:dihydroorotase
MKTNAAKLKIINQLLSDLVACHQIGTWNAYFIMDRLLADFEECNEYPNKTKVISNDGSQCYLVRDDDSSTITINEDEDL